MLVKFDSDAGTLTMFGHIAVQLLKATGHTGAVPGAFLPEELPAAIERLKAAVQDMPAGAAPPQTNSDAEPGTELPVSLKQRAFPLVELLERAAQQECEVLWR